MKRKEKQVIPLTLLAFTLFLENISEVLKIQDKVAGEFEVTSVLTN